ncbi:MAG: hypothetical protein ACI8QC_001830 [Planctomycetota bacterium]|jgi:hypothetical protein
MILSMRTLIPVLLALLAPVFSAAPAMAQAGSADPPPISRRLPAEHRECVCAAMCTYANAIGFNDDKSTVTPANKLSAKIDLAKALKECIDEGLSYGSYVDSCECVDAAGNTFTYTLRFVFQRTKVKAKGSEDMVIAIGGLHAGSNAAGNARAENTGPGDAIAIGGANVGTGAGGDAVAVTTSGDALAIGGAGAATSAGGSGMASSTTGHANAHGGSGGNAGGSSSVAGGVGGSASASYGGSSFAAAGISPVPTGQHGTGASAVGGPGVGSSNGGGFYVN